jgi:hypothetical protein
VLDFEVFKDRGARRRKDRPVVTLQKKQIMALNPAAYEALGSPVAVELLYAAKARTIGIRAADPAQPHAYVLRQPKRSQTRVVSVQAFLGHYGIEVLATERYPATMIGDVLAVDLNRQTEHHDGP